MGTSASRFNTPDGFTDFARGISRRIMRIDDEWETWQYEYSCAQLAHYFAIRHFKRQRPYIVFTIREYNVITRFCLNDECRDNVELFQRFFQQAVKKQDEQILAYTEYQGRGYW